LLLDPALHPLMLPLTNTLRQVTFSANLQKNEISHWKVIAQLSIQL